MDHVLFALANLFRIYKYGGIEDDVSDHMVRHIELRWAKGADQELFILAVLLNPYVRGSCFNCAVLSTTNLLDIATRAFERVFKCSPDFHFNDTFEDYLEWRENTDYSEEAMWLEYHKHTAEQKGQVCLSTISIMTVAATRFKVLY